MTISVTEIDQLLPQTQCEQCGYPGCRPYAEAILKENAPLDRCVPGGTTTLTALGQLLQQDIRPQLTTMAATQKPPLLAIINETLCIGCTKCISACPVDAIIGSRQKMHSVLAQECTGCELCLPVCPMDCIDLVAKPHPTANITEAERDQRRLRYHAKQQRAKQHITSQEPVITPTQNRQDYVAMALARVKTQHAQKQQNALNVAKDI